MHGNEDGRVGTRFGGRAARLALAGAALWGAFGAVGCNSGSRSDLGEVPYGDGQARGIGSVGATDGSEEPAVQAAQAFDPSAETRLNVGFKGHGRVVDTNDVTPSPDERAFFAFDGDLRTFWRPYQSYQLLHVGARLFGVQEVQVEAVGVTLARNVVRAAGPFPSAVLRIEVAPEPLGPFTVVGRYALPEGREHHLLAFEPVAAGYVRAVLEEYNASNGDEPLFAEVAIYAAPGGAPEIERALPQTLTSLERSVLLAERNDLASFGGAVIQERHARDYPSTARFLLDRDPTTAWEAYDVDASPGCALIAFAADRATEVDGVLLRLPADRHQPLWIEVIGAADPGAGIDACSKLADLLVPADADHVRLDFPAVTLSRLGLVLRSGWSGLQVKVQDLSILEASPSGAPPAATLAAAVQ